MSREWTDVARQCWRWYQFATSDVLSIVRGLANGYRVALHAVPAATPAAAATSATPTVASVTLVTSAFALRCSDLYDMFFESLGIFRPKVKSANYASPQNLFVSRFSDLVSSKDSRSTTSRGGECSFFSSNPSKFIEKAVTRVVKASN